MHATSKIRPFTASSILGAFCALSLSSVATARTPRAPSQTPSEPMSVQQLAQSAAELLRDGKHEEALSAFDDAIRAAGRRVPIELTLGRAAALALTQPGEAESTLRGILGSDSPEHVRAAAAFHLGAIEASRAEQALPLKTVESSGAEALSNADAALATLRRAERFYRTSHQLHAGDGAAATNVELVQRRIGAIKDSLRRQQEQAQKQQSGKKDASDQSRPEHSEAGEPRPDQQQGQGEQSGDDSSASTSRSLSDELRDLADQQQRAADESSTQAQRGPDDQTKDQRAAESATRQRALNERTQQAARKAGDQQTPRQDASSTPSETPTQQKLKEAAASQKQAEQQLKDGKFDEAAAAQQRAADALREAQRSAAADEARRESESQQRAQQQAQQQGEQPPGRPFDATAAQILDRERWVREQLRRLQAQMRSRTAPVEKDW